MPYAVLHLCSSTRSSVTAASRVEAEAILDRWCRRAARRSGRTFEAVRAEYEIMD